MTYSEKRIKIAQYCFDNPLDEKHKYQFYILDNPYSVCNKEKRELCAITTRIVKQVQKMTKGQLIHSLNQHKRAAFLDMWYRDRKGMQEAWIVQRITKKALANLTK